MATPQPIALPGLYTIAAGPNNLQDNLPANAYPYHVAWATDRPGSAGYMVSNGSVWTSNAGPEGPAGPTGAPGADGNTILSGTGAPGSGLGKNGDFYVDVSAPMRMYGPKLSGVWGSGVSMIGPQGATGNTGSAGAQGPAGFGTIAPSISSRVIGTAFRPSTTNAVRVSYTVRTQVTNPLLIGTSTASVVLYSDANTTPTTERARVEASSGVGVTVTISLTTANTATLSYIVPAGHYVLLSSNVTGTGATSIVSQVEEVLG